MYITFLIEIYKLERDTKRSKKFTHNSVTSKSVKDEDVWEINFKENLQNLSAKYT